MKKLLKGDIKVRKNGGKVHVASRNSSVTGCGFWLKADTSYYKTDDTANVTCLKCNPYQEDLEVIP